MDGLDLNRQDWPGIDWPARIRAMGMAFVKRWTQISMGTLLWYQRGGEPSYRMGLMIIHLGDGKQPVRVQVDWFRIICDLKAAGCSTFEVSRDTAIPQSTLIGYKGGAEPKYGDGEILIEYYRFMTGKTLDEVPLRETVLSAAKVK